LTGAQEKIKMSATTIATISKMLEQLPIPAQKRVVEHIQEYIEDLRDELHWDKQFESSQSPLTSAARKAREQISEGRSTPLDIDEL
jgi:hypothetical protein